jgi:beta-mannosidase
MIKHIIFSLIFIIVLNAGFSRNIDLGNNQWYFKQANQKSKWLPAKVPGNIHTDLLDNKLIPDPFYGKNEELVQWVENEDWVYQCKFKVDSNLYSEQNINLVFEGIDTYADVYLNDKKILTATNMFRSWKLNIKKGIKLGFNHLKVVFKSDVKKAKELYQSLSAKLPNDERVMIRKAQYQFGWDWGPRLVTCGIYKKVFIEAWSDIKIENTHFVQKEINNNSAQLDLNLEINAKKSGEYYISIINKENSNKLKDTMVLLKSGISNIRIPFEIKQVQLWWCNGLGKPYLYELETSIISSNKKFDKTSSKIGIKKLELVQKEDTFGRSFYFKLNDIPVYMKGANYIPQDNFVARTNKSTYRHLLEQAQKSNMNMLRVWGGGIYEYDEFYNICDEFGLLVWQDFMFACAMYPGDSTFLNNVKQESIDQVKRLRNHASLAIWCGNNEISEGWFNWGWQKQFNYTAADSTRIWNDYRRIFHEILPQTISDFDKSHVYWPSSPEFGWGRKESLLKGDAHYWGVWWGEEPFDMYTKKVGRFMSEYGFQGFPSIQTFLEFTDTNHFHLDSSVIRLHNKHPKGIQTIKKYMERDYKVPTDFKDFAYVSQCLQADGIKIAIEAHRSKTPYNMGTLYWQLNDCWPVISWSGMDYKHRWKALQYQVKRSFEPMILSFQEDGDSIKLYVVSDLINAENGDLEIKLEDFNGMLLMQQNQNVSIPNLHSTLLKTFSKSDLIAGRNKDEILLNVSLKTSNNQIITAKYYFVKVKDMKLKNSEFALKLIPNKDGFDLELKAKNFHKNVWIDCDGELSDNFFDMRANESKTIQIKTQKSIETFFIDLKSANLLK